MARNSDTCDYGDCQSGDLILFGPTNLVGQICSFAQWPWRFHHRYAHVGVVVQTADCGQLLLVESTVDPGLGPCWWANRPVDGVQSHQLAKRLEIHRRRGGKMWRLPPGFPLLVSEDTDLFFAAARLRGRPYDYRGAWRARDILFGWLIRLIRRVIRRPSQNGREYMCSEFAGKLLQEAGRLPQDFRPEAHGPKSLADELLTRDVCYPPIPLM